VVSIVFAIAETNSYLLPNSHNVTLDGLHIASWYIILGCE